MDDTQSMTQTPVADRPLITFALFAYNQEKFIREAVAGAFSQTFEPLEIILSDDCSTDRTFEIMQDMAATYKGPHRVRVRRNAINLGTLSHVLTVASESDGKFIVVGAGDDISLPQRAESLYEAWRQSRASIILSNFSSVDEIGLVVKPVCEISKIHKDPYFGEATRRKRVFGAVAAYERALLAVAPLPISAILVEDIVFELIAAALGVGIFTVETVLVMHREHNDNISQRDTSGFRRQDLRSREKLSSRRDFLYCEALSYFLQAVAPKIECQLHEAGFEKRRFQAQIALLRSRGLWWDATIATRLQLVFTVRDSKFTRWAIPRLFGLEFFCCIRQLFS